MDSKQQSRIHILLFFRQQVSFLIPVVQKSPKHPYVIIKWYLIKSPYSNIYKLGNLNISLEQLWSGSSLPVLCVHKKVDWSPFKLGLTKRGQLGILLCSDIYVQLGLLQQPSKISIKFKECFKGPFKCFIHDEARGISFFNFNFCNIEFLQSSKVFEFSPSFKRTPN